MVKLMEYKNVEYQNNMYTVINIRFKSHNLPIVMNKEVFDVIKKDREREWFLNDNFILFTKTSINDQIVNVYIHDIVYRLKNPSYDVSKPILHINCINLDNRIENLNLDVKNKAITKNLKKKERTIDLSKFGIDVDTLPSFVWYLESDNTHGNRFMVDLGIMKWKSTSCKELSLRYKLEETKKFLRQHKKNNPELFRKLSMNGDLNEVGNKLRNEFYDIIKLANYKYTYARNNKTDIFLKEDLTGLTEHEIELLKS